jgi:hypothetical protein
VTAWNSLVVGLFLIRVDSERQIEQHLDAVPIGHPGRAEAEQEGRDEDVHDAAKEGDLDGMALAR